MVLLAAAATLVAPARVESAPQTDQPPPADDAPGRDYQHPVLIRFEGVIFPMLEQFFYRKLNEAKQAGADLIIVEIESPGGDAAISFEIAGTLRDLDWADTVAYVPATALSGAAIVALGCDEIIMRPNAVLGDAGPIAFGPDRAFRRVPEKVRTDLARRIRDLAAAGERSEALAEAMIDDNLTVFEVTHRETGEKRFLSDADIQATGEPAVWEKDRPVLETRETRFLEVNGTRAVELGLADGNAADREDLFRQLGLQHPPMILERKAVDVAVTILNSPLVTGLLFVVGLIALYIEMSSPGISIGGLIALLCFVLFFWSRFLGGTADLLEVLLFLTGIAFIAIELFLIPGFGVAGILGLLLMVGSVLMASQRFLIPNTPRQMESLSTSLVVVTCSSAVFLTAAAWLTRHFGTLPVLNRMVLRPATAANSRTGTTGGGDKDAGAGNHGAKSLELARHGDGDIAVGDWGVAVSSLRPAGKVRIGSRMLNVVTDGSFVDAGRQVRVIEIQGHEIVVRDVDDD
jgi:membrane-bound serine protease (ClpP class)